MGELGPLSRCLHWSLAPQRRRLLIGVLVALAVGSGGIMLRRALKRSSDFPMTVAFGHKLLVEGENVYETQLAGGTHTKYPPFFFVFTAPFGLGPLALGAVLWHLLGLACVVGCAWWAAAAVQPLGASAPSLARVLAPIALAAPMVATNLHLGQSNLLVLALVAASLFLVSRRRDGAGGLTLATAMALKLTPALLVAGFAWKRAGRVLAGVVLGLVLCWGVLPAAVFGPTRALEVTRSWSRVVLGFVQQGAAAEVTPQGLIGYRQTNQSLDAAARRFLADVPAVRAEDGRAELRVNVFDLDVHAPIIDVFVKGTSLALLLGLLWLARGALDTQRRLALGLDLSLALIVILVVTPIAWDSHYVALLVPYAVTLEAIRRRPCGDFLRAWLQRALGACVLLSVLGLCPYMRAFSVLLLGALLLAAALVAARVALRREAAAGG